MNVKSITLVVLAVGVLTGCQITQSNDDIQDIGSNAYTPTLEFEPFDMCLYTWHDEYVVNSYQNEIEKLREDLNNLSHRILKTEKENQSLKNYISQKEKVQREAYNAFKNSWCNLPDADGECKLK